MNANVASCQIIMIIIIMIIIFFIISDAYSFKNMGYKTPSIVSTTWILLPVIEVPVKREIYNHYIIVHSWWTHKRWKRMVRIKAARMEYPDF